MKNQEHKKLVLDWFDAFYSMLFTYIGGVIKLAPIGVMFLMADCFGKYGFAILGSMAKMIVSVYISVFAQILIVYCGALLIFTRILPHKFLTRISKNSPTSIGGEMNCHLLHSVIVGM